MEAVLMNMIVDENRVVTAVTASRKLDIMTDEANKALAEFYEKHKGTKDIWATFAVCGSCEKFGVPVRSTVVCREEDVEKTKAQFKTVETVKLFSLQTVKIEDLNSLLAGDRLDDEKFFRSDAERSVMRSKMVEQYANELNEKLQTCDSDALIAMKHLLCIGSQKTPPTPKKTTTQLQKVDSLFKKACERQKTPKSTPEKKARKSPWSKEKTDTSNGVEDDSADSPNGGPSQNTRRVASSQKNIEVDQDDSPVKVTKQASVKKNLSNRFPAPSSSKAKKSNKDIFDDEDSSPEKSKEVKVEEPPELVEVTMDHKEATPEFIEVTNKRKRSPAPAKRTKEAAESSQKSEEPQEVGVSCETDHVPKKKKKMVKTVETYKDEDGFLVTKEVVQVVETDEPEESPSKPLRPANTNKAPNPPHPKKKSASTGTQKISAFFTKK